ncbi:hypothetical protein K440DRAFT_636657 [Wilcoxina mikolae CBS 423.85]|nr:hypothetical protein K440DRAFT_636657 [Wilcoxina mikolae CBS 423.85]
MPTKTFKTDYGNVPKLTENNNPMWREKVRRVFVGADAYEIITREEPQQEGNTREGHAELCNCRERQNDAHSIIYMGCSDEILPHIKNTTNPAEMWNILQDRIDSTLSKLGQTEILQ